MTRLILMAVCITILWVQALSERRWAHTKSIITEAVDIVGGWSQVKRGVVEGVPFTVYLMALGFLACAIC